MPNNQFAVAGGVGWERGVITEVMEFTEMSTDQHLLLWINRQCRGKHRFLFPKWNAYVCTAGHEMSPTTPWHNKYFLFHHVTSSPRGRGPVRGLQSTLNGFTLSKVLCGQELFVFLELYGWKVFYESERVLQSDIKQCTVGGVLMISLLGKIKISEIWKNKCIWRWLCTARRVTQQRHNPLDVDVRPLWTEGNQIQLLVLFYKPFSFTLIYFNSPPATLIRAPWDMLPINRHVSRCIFELKWIHQPWYDYNLWLAVQKKYTVKTDSLASISSSIYSTSKLSYRGQKLDRMMSSAETYDDVTEVTWPIFGPIKPVVKVQCIACFKHQKIHCHIFVLYWQLWTVGLREKKCWSWYTRRFIFQYTITLIIKLQYWFLEWLLHV